MLSICSKKCYVSSSQSLFQALSLSESLPNMGGHNFEILLGSLLFFRRRDFDISGNIFLPQEMISLPILVYSQNVVNIIMICFKCFRRFHLGTSMHWLMKGLLLFLCTVLWLKCGVDTFVRTKKGWIFDNTVPLTALLFSCLAASMKGPTWIFFRNRKLFEGFAGLGAN